MNAFVLTLCLANTGGGLAKDVTQLPFSTSKVSGQLWGKKFVPTRVEIQKIGIQKNINRGLEDQSMQWAIKFRTGKDFFADQEIAVWISIDVNEKFDGLKVIERPHRFADGSDQDFTWKGKPRSIGMGLTAVFLNEKDSKQKERSLSDRYSAKAVFGKRVGNKIPGKILLSLPDGKGSLSGSFTAVFEK